MKAPDNGRLADQYLSASTVRSPVCQIWADQIEWYEVFCSVTPLIGRIGRQDDPDPALLAKS
jgi:hypothetical protein